MLNMKIFLGIICICCLSCDIETKKETSPIYKTSPPESAQGHLQVYLQEFDVYFYPDSCIGKTSISLLGEEGQLDADIADCKGKMKIRQFNKSGALMIEGFYENSLDTLKKYSIGKSAIDGTRGVSIMEYFQPLAEGTWIYYINGKESKKKIYHKGILLDFSGG